MDDTEARPETLLDRAESMEHSAKCNHGNATTMRGYLEWSTDDDQRAWAITTAWAYDSLATAEECYAAALRKRAGGRAVPGVYTAEQAAR